VKWQVLGSGSAFYVGKRIGENFQSNFLLIQNGKRLLVDAGSDIRFSMRKTGLKPADITDIYLSHTHGDHDQGLEYLGFAMYFARLPRPRLYASQKVLDILWEHGLSGAMRSIQQKRTTLETFFEVHPIGPNSTFEWAGTQFQPVQAIHVMDGFELMPCYGLVFETDKLRVYFTCDTQFAPNQIMDFYRDADIIFHDSETTKYMSGVHAHYSQLRTLPDEIRAKMWLYHYNEGSLPNAREDGFRGFLKRGQLLDFNRPETLDSIDTVEGTSHST